MASIVVVGILGQGAGRGFAADEDQQLHHALAGIKHTLAEGIEQAAKAPTAALSAKFEIEDGKLSLSVDTAEKGLATPAEKNVLNELAGSPLAEKWTPEVESFKDVAHVSRASEQLTLLALSHASLLDIAKNAQRDQIGTIISITPVLENRSPLFLVQVDFNGRLVELHYNMKGERMVNWLR
ncbi:MAG TPA: hypothetical protein VGY55_12510 [Pirellulales bacterium]|jgi:hypothetical protein|nr:hypothetical protein [Pirellulales bacterium]